MSLHPDATDFVASGNGGNLAVALALAKAGLPIFPAWCSWDKDKQKWEKVPLVKGWQTAASTDPTQINKWWMRWPDAVPGIELGRADLIVLDPDRHAGKADGVEAFEQLVADNRPLPPHPIAVTAGGGQHHYFRKWAGEKFGNSEGKLRGLEVNVRGVGGWVVAPGSFRADGKRWGPAGLTTAYNGKEIPVLPDWLAALIRTPKEAKQPEAAAKVPEPWSQKKEDEVRTALERIPSADRAVWFKVGAALYWTGWQNAREMWDTWSKTTPTSFDEADQEKTWKSYGRSFSGKPATLASIFAIANDKPAGDDQSNTRPIPKEPVDSGGKVKKTWRDFATTAPALCDERFPTVKFLIPGLLPEGVMILASRPKLGKFPHVSGSSGSTRSRRFDRTRAW
jgi:hypothetical protein